MNTVCVVFVVCGRFGGNQASPLGINKAILSDLTDRVLYTAARDGNWQPYIAYNNLKPSHSMGIYGPHVHLYYTNVKQTVYVSWIHVAYYHRVMENRQKHYTTSWH